MAYSCQANAVLAEASPEEAHEAFLYGKHLGIAFQLVDDLLDFVSSADMLGKPAAADLQLGLATAPVLFASSEFPQLHAMITRRLVLVRFPDPVLTLMRSQAGNPFYVAFQEQKWKSTK